MNHRVEFRNAIDDYEQTIHAIVGFINFYRYDDETKKIKDNVLIFQGRRLVPSPNKAINLKGEKIPYVTPDIGILLPSKNGVLGEVKKSFPQEQELWFSTFEQLMSYDDDLTGWPSNDEKVISHDIILLLHQSRAVVVCEYYNNKKDSEIKFNRPFVIIQFNRADERIPYYFFQKRLGDLTEKHINNKLHYGTSVPMDDRIPEFSIIKIYDSEPPLPYLIDLIWTNVVLGTALKNQKYEKLRKNQMIDVILEIDTIVDELHKGFSFYTLYKDYPERQEKIPKKEWIIRVCEVLVKYGEAEWIDSTKSSIKVFFRTYDDTLDHFIDICSEGIQHIRQTKIFEENES